MQGTVLDGRYLLLERIGSGGMGTVWRARDKRLGREVAVKTMGSLDLGGDDAARVERRFQREAQLAGRLSSPHIVTVHDSGRADVDGRGVLYLVMELLRGRSLDRRLRDGLPPLAEVADWTRQICQALEVAHAGGVVHRDLKPANVWLGEDGQVKVLDFGIARSLHDTAVRTRLTLTGAVVGTPAYLSPEQALGADGERPVDERSDLYSLGCMLYEMVTSGPPFRAGSVLALLNAHARETPRPPRELRGDLPPQWDELIRELLAKEPERRPGNAAAVRARIEGAPKAPTAAPTAAPAPAPQLAAPAPAGGAAGTDVVLPALGESVTEGTVTRWLKAVGEKVEAGEPLLEVSTDKVDTEIPAPVAGTLLEITVGEDETAEVGAKLGVIDAAGAAPAAAPAAPAAPAADEKDWYPRRPADAKRRAELLGKARERDRLRGGLPLGALTDREKRALRVAGALSLAGWVGLALGLGQHADLLIAVPAASAVAFLLGLMALGRFTRYVPAGRNPGADAAWAAALCLAAVPVTLVAGFAASTPSTVGGFFGQAIWLLAYPVVVGMFVLIVAAAARGEDHAPEGAGVVTVDLAQPGVVAVVVGWVSGMWTAGAMLTGGRAWWVAILAGGVVWLASALETALVGNALRVRALRRGA